MKKNLFKIFVLLMILALVAAPVSAKTIEAAPAFDDPDPRDPQEVSQEILDLFEGGITIDELLLLNKGPIPHALQEYANKPMVVIVQMERLPLAEYMVTQGLDAKSMASTDQKSYTSSLKSAQESVVSQVKRFGGVVMGQYTVTYNGLLVKVTAEQLKTLREMNGVEAIKRAPQHEISLINSIPLINADDVWNSIPGYTGDGVTIGVIDTGIDYTHAMFGGAGTPVAYSSNNPDIIEPGSSFPTLKVVGGYDFAGTDYDANDENFDVPVPDADPLDEGGHGTHVASTAAGIDFNPLDSLGSGVAPDAKLYALKVFGANGSTNLAMNAIEWATDPDGDGDTSDHLDVINLSLGSSFGPGDPTDPENIAVENAAAAGVFIAASAGNSGDSSYITGGPAAADSALSVAASSTSDVIGSFSSRGPRGYDSILKPEISAPGVSIFAAEMGGGNTGKSLNGTSMASPHIAGVAALMKEAHSNWTVEQIKAAMMNTAVDLVWGAGNVDIPRQGAGRVDALRSVMTEALAVGDTNVVSLSWGLIESAEDLYTDEKTIKLYNFSNQSKTYDVVVAFTNGSETGVTLTHTAGSTPVTVPANSNVMVPLELTIDMTQIPLVFGTHEEFYGFVSFIEHPVDINSEILRVPFYFSPRPYTEMTKTSTSDSFDPVMGVAEMELMQSGPKASSLRAFPVLLVDPEEPAQLDAADLRYVGMDSNGTYITIAFAMEGPIHTQQHLFSEVNLYIDSDQDGSPETLNFNFNLSWAQSGNGSNDWIILKEI